MRDSFFKKSFLLCLLFALTACQFLQRLKTKDLSVTTETATEKSKPLVGLFISDAGANTFAAIPILEFFQQQNLQFDVIAGSGWGAWLGAFYAKNQNMNQAKWNLFKLQEKKLFQERAFISRKKQTRQLKKSIEQAFLTPLKVPFFCPAINRKEKLVLLSGVRPVRAVLSCLQLVPPLSFQFEKSTQYQGSFLSVKQVLYEMKKRKIDLVVWIKSPIQLGLFREEEKESAKFWWSEWVRFINDIKTEDFVFVFEPKAFSFSIYDFSKIDAIIKTPLPLSLNRRFRILKEKLKIVSEKKAHSMEK